MVGALRGCLKPVAELFEVVEGVEFADGSGGEREEGLGGRVGAICLENAVFGALPARELGGWCRD